MYAARTVSVITLEMQPELDPSSGCYIVNNGLKKSIKYSILKLEYHSLIMAQRISIPVKNSIQPQHVGKSMTGEDDTCIFSLRLRLSIILDDDDDKAMIHWMIF